MSAELDIIIPVYNEGDHILPVLRELQQEMKTSFRVLICYDHDDDTTLKRRKRNQFRISTFCWSGTKERRLGPC